MYHSEAATGRPQFSKEGELKYYSQYLDCPNEPLYPFGYGLSYTEFSYGPVELSTNVLHEGEKIQASVKLKNTGSRRGTEVVQLYLQDLFGSSVRPQRELKDFQRITLEPGEEQIVTFTIEEPMLRFFTENRIYESEPGRFRAFIGSSSAENDYVEFTLQ